MKATPGLFNLVCGVGYFGKIVSARGQHQVQNTDSKMN